MQSISEFSDPVLSARDIFQALETCDANELSDLLDESQFDLTTLDDTTGRTILHHAINLWRDDVMGMLLQRAQHDPAVLNTEDSQGNVPLVFAAEKGRVELMQAIIKAGGHAGNNVTLDGTIGGRPPGAWVRMALMLIEAQGDVSKAFALAVQHRQSDAAKAFFRAGARTLSALQSGDDAIRWMSNVRCLQADEVLTALKGAIQMDDVQSVLALTRSETVLLALDNVTDRSDAKIAELLKAFIQAGANAEDMVELSVGQCVKYGLRSRTPDMRTFLRDIGSGHDPFGVLKQLFNAGASGVPELIWQAERKRDVAVELMIRSGADALSALKVMPSSCRSLVARSALVHVLQQRDLPQAERLSQLKALMRARADDEAEKLTRDLIRQGRSFDDVRLLMLAGVHPSDELLVSIVRAARFAEHERVVANEPGHSSQRQFVRQLIHSGVDFSKVVAQFRSDRHAQAVIINDYCRTNRLPESAKVNLLRANPKIKAAQDVLNLIMYAMLQDVLSKTSLSHTEKVAQLKKLMAHEAMPAAGELLNDAVIAGHSATMKLLVLAEAPVTATFVNLSRRLVTRETSARTGAQQLIRLGADYQPAMRELRESIQAYIQKGEHVAATREQDALNALGSTIAMEFVPRGPSNPGGMVLPE